MNFSDDSDRASHLEVLERQHLIEKARRNTNKMPYIGRCYFCEEPTPSPRIFCDSDCRDLYERVQEARRRNGVG